MTDPLPGAMAKSPSAVVIDDVFPFLIFTILRRRVMSGDCSDNCHLFVYATGSAR